MKLLKKFYYKAKCKIKDIYQWFKKTRICKKVRQWLLYGVAFSFVPYGLVQLTNFLVGYPVSIIDTFPDYLLITFAVAGNALGVVEDTDKKIKDNTRIRFQHISWFTLIVTIALYFALFNDSFATSRVSALIEKYSIGLVTVKMGIDILLLINILGVIAFEVISSNTELKEENINKPDSVKVEK